MMESSPLAAMHPSPIGAWRPNRNNRLDNGNVFGAGPFNIRDQLQRTKPDYFNMRPAQPTQGSSPTNLAVDLGQNFRIDSETRYVHIARLLDLVPLGGRA